MTARVLLSSKSDEWMTPKVVIDRLCRNHYIGLDPCASPLSHVEAITEFRWPVDGLEQMWTLPGADEEAVVWVQPPYSKLAAWVEKCAGEAAMNNVPVVLLCPARLETRAFQEFVLPYARMLAISGRLVFERDVEIEHEEITRRIEACTDARKLKSLNARLARVEEAYLAGAKCVPSDSATFPSVIIHWNMPSIEADFADFGQWLGAVK